MMLTCGFSQARRNRLGHPRHEAGRSEEWTDATHRSNPSRMSSGQSTVPSGAMFSSVPCSRSHCMAAVGRDPLGQLAQLVPLLQHLLGGHPLHEQVRRVIGDREIVVPARPCRGDHFLRAFRRRRSGSCACAGHRGCRRPGPAPAARPSARPGPRRCSRASAAGTHCMPSLRVDLLLGVADQAHLAALDLEQAVLGQLQPLADGDLP